MKRSSSRNARNDEHRPTSSNFNGVDLEINERSHENVERESASELGTHNHANTLDEGHNYESGQGIGITSDQREETACRGARDRHDVYRGSSVEGGHVTRSHIIEGARPQRNELGQDMWKKLKRVSIPVFDGDVIVYENWKAAFMACIDQAPATAEYKLLQLRQYLTGEALKTIENLGHSSAAYDAAKERLERKYGGKWRQISLQLETLHNFKLQSDLAIQKTSRNLQIY
ncbi:hypothetical protein HOLleu_07774 [Holothuria leucospilota]|uniref:Uncharacterized protein n=1 Tax=Holothuria leucospilota TaxID=206669 RepID=A0A9Q1CHU8_HOLLE|nr:hypothetical protein HOLleu_07774 [Holothuria leucospilota]